MACPEHLGSCSASAASFFVSPPAPSESYRSSLLASDSTLPVGEECQSGKEMTYTFSKATGPSDPSLQNSLLYTPFGLSGSGSPFAGAVGQTEGQKGAQLLTVGLTPGIALLISNSSLGEP